MFCSWISYTCTRYDGTFILERVSGLYGEDKLRHCRSSLIRQYTRRLLPV